MDVSYSIHYWMFLPQVWVVLGILLVGIELFDGSMFALPLGVAALVMAALVHSQNELWFGDVVFFESWRGVLMTYALLSVVSIGVLKYVFQFRLRKNDSDVNKY